jgi:hypothetical protein
MGIINRTMDASEQKDQVQTVVMAPVNAQEIPLFVAPRACTISDVKASLLGISGAPNLLLRVQRFVPGTGGSTFNVGSTFTVAAFGTSGLQGASLPAAGSTTLNLVKGDVLSAIHGGGSGAASTATIIELVVQYAQDIKTWY